MQKVPVPDSRMVRHIIIWVRTKPLEPGDKLKSPRAERLGRLAPELRQNLQRTPLLGEDDSGDGQDQTNHADRYTD